MHLAYELGYTRADLRARMTTRELRQWGAWLMLKGERETAAARRRR